MTDQGTPSYYQSQKLTEVQSLGKEAWEGKSSDFRPKKSQNLLHTPHLRSKLLLGGFFVDIRKARNIRSKRASRKLEMARAEKDAKACSLEDLHRAMGRKGLKKAPIRIARYAVISARQNRKDGTQCEESS